MILGILQGTFLFFLLFLKHYTINIYLRQLWTDARLKYAHTISATDSITLTPSLITRMWVPDAFFENGKDEVIHDVTGLNAAFRVYKNGSVFYSQRFRLHIY